ncbi:MAG: YitT family protein [Oscillospiraceae bacterium]|nr:YitT family protein [Oscillospiraceae bacterium]
MKKNGMMDWILWFAKIILGSAVFAVGFDLFLEPNDLNAGGVSGISMILIHLIGFGSVGTVTMLINLPLFILGGVKIGKKFFIGSLIGMVSSSVLLDVFAMLPGVQAEPLVSALYGGVLCGLGLGVVFATGASTGGSDIVVRLLKLKYQNVPIGTINMVFDLAVSALTGLVFWDITKALYSGIAIFVSGKVIDAVVYSFDYSKVVLIISDHYEAIAKRIFEDLDRGATYLEGTGSYSGSPKKVIMTVVKQQQVAELKQFVMEIDPRAFLVVQEAHQVLGEGFAHYSKESL